MAIQVTRRASTNADRAGDPLDGLVNLFDLGIVLAVAFMLAALSSLDRSPSSLPQAQDPAADQVRVAPGQRTEAAEPSGSRAVGRGTRLGTVYQLEDGRTIVVRDR